MTDKLLYGVDKNSETDTELRSELDDIEVAVETSKLVTRELSLVIVKVESNKDGVRDWTILDSPVPLLTVSIDDNAINVISFDGPMLLISPTFVKIYIYMIIVITP